MTDKQAVETNPLDGQSLDTTKAPDYLNSISELENGRRKLEI
jgi:hypothetical protein